jgi:hypothetical protein
VYKKYPNYTIAYWVALTDKGKPSKRMGRKTYGLRIAQAIYGGWVAEVEKKLFILPC